MKTLELVPRGSLLFAMFYNTCPKETLGTTYDEEGLPHLLERFVFDLHCSELHLLVVGVYSDDYPSFGMSPIYYNIVSAEIVNPDGSREDLTRPVLYEAITGDWSMSDPHDSIQP
jgi:hypothetical protein